MDVFAADVESVLRRSGWFPGRTVGIEGYKEELSGFTWHEAAEKFLGEFGGISVDVHGAGQSVAREPFEIDPELAIGEEGRFEELSQKFQRKFFPVGEIGRGEFFIAIDEEAVLYLVGVWAFRLGVCTEGLTSMIRGVKAVKLEIPDR
ncbi:SUKH-3 domain-containing protein [Streptomyces sp. NBC_00102]|uniref:SUKH-3 domain-containing protein n=1 Tax=Streptomyces sp. NBC_00102 TaxID=2975652 RepID=UPI00224DC4A3|nr:SUKH-3 domain-containing protein [Streptomyces sp. NBC_00102]MCX5396889.1 SUKH-3 domain-containing protein [Streptomyces sp. NBC_00102]